MDTDDQNHAAASMTLVVDCSSLLVLVLKTRLLVRLTSAIIKPADYVQVWYNCIGQVQCTIIIVRDKSDVISSRHY